MEPASGATFALPPQFVTLSVTSSQPSRSDSFLCALSFTSSNRRLPLSFSCNAMKDVERGQGSRRDGGAQVPSTRRSCEMSSVRAHCVFARLSLTTLQRVRATSEASMTSCGWKTKAERGARALAPPLSTSWGRGSCSSRTARLRVCTALCLPSTTCCKRSPACDFTQRRRPTTRRSRDHWHPLAELRHLRLRLDLSSFPSPRDSPVPLPSTQMGARRLSIPHAARQLPIAGAWRP
ncbi:hypothetical protein DMC30DRAFT_401634 [Rhodotorula diobovata]|uniref:Uncharacterized protein n=1 Tax=Rhodotorula diobovata TaxID=5288 RepID=A0A5C5FQ47_9BASI|nr:hypothetical protein DMC30DRAFT_401634 [Rhodotorula diobovata]